MLLAAAFMVSCSSGSGLNYEKNGVCKSDYSALDLGSEDSYSSKVSLKAGEPFLPEVNEYAYAGVDFYFFDQARKIKIHLQEVQDSKTGEFKTGIVCVSRESVGFYKEPISYSLTFVSDIKTSPTEALQIKTRTFQFDLRPRENKNPWLITSVTSDRDEFFIGAPQEFFSNFQSVEQYFLKPKTEESTYQLLSHLKNTPDDQRPTPDSNLIVRARVKMKTVN